MPSSPTTPAAPSNPLKRQRTLVDMLHKSSSSPDNDPAASASASATPHPPAKRPKTATAAATPVHSALQPLNAIPFSLSAFTAGLNDENKELLELECRTLHLSWLKILASEITKPYFIALKRFLAQEGVRGPDSSIATIYPPARDIYSWSNTPLGKVRVVIIGQDPYHGPKQAHGLCFSVPEGVQVPPSLKNIYAELQREYDSFTPPKHGNLTAWARSGVLLLNTCLTVRARQAGSHSKKGWETFTDAVVDVVDRYGGANLIKDSKGVGRGVVFLAWGAWAAQRVAKLSKTKHLILTSAHPSPLSAHRGFLGNDHFKKANAWLQEKYGPEGIVNWGALDAAAPAAAPAAVTAAAAPAVTISASSTTTSAVAVSESRVVTSTVTSSESV